MQDVQSVPHVLDPGTYEHYSGKKYEVIGIARHSETLEELVVYQALYGRGDMWVRPFTMFTEAVQVHEKPVPRFRRVTKS